MSVLSSDTHPKMEALQIQLWRQASPTRKMQMLAQLNSSARTLALTGLQDGDYTAYWFSPQTGAWSEPASVTVQGGAANLPIADFTRDLAVKLVPAGEPRTP